MSFTTRKAKRRGQSPALQIPGVLTKEEESSECRHPMDGEKWHALTARVRDRLKDLDSEQIRLLAEKIDSGILWLDPVMTRYCELTCPSCEDPCCTGRRVFFNETDVIFLVASKGPMPPGQTRSSETAPCRYLTEGGCLLPRHKRPYVCVWFLCEPQMELFHEESPAFQRELIAVLQEVRHSRLMLDALCEYSFPGISANVRKGKPGGL